MRRRYALAIACGLLGVLLTAARPKEVQAEIRYDVIDLGALSAFGFSQATGIYAAGQVIGVTDSGGFLWQDGVITALSAIGCPGCRSQGINAAGQIVGAVQRGTNVNAFLWHNGAMIDLGALGGVSSAALAINDAGQVVGESDVSGTHHAFLCIRLNDGTDHSANFKFK